MEQAEFKYGDYPFATFVLLAVYSAYGLLAQRTGLAEDYARWESASVFLVATCGVLTMTFLSEAFGPRRVIQVNSVLLACAMAASVAIMFFAVETPMYFFVPYIVFLAHGLLGVVTVLTARDMRRHHVIQYWGFIRLLRLAGGFLFGSLFHPFSSPLSGLLLLLAAFTAIAVWSFFQTTTPREKTSGCIEPKAAKSLGPYGLILTSAFVAFANFVLVRVFSTSFMSLMLPSIGLLALIANIAVCYNADRLVRRFGFHGLLAISFVCLVARAPASMLISNLGSVTGELGLSLSCIALYALVAKSTDSLFVISLLHVSSLSTLLFPSLFGAGIPVVFAWIVCVLLVVGAVPMGLRASWTKEKPADVESKAAGQ